MPTDDPTPLDRKTWRHLVELHVAGRITRAALQRLTGLFAQDRPATPAVPRAPPRLTLLHGGVQPPPPSPPSPPTPSPREVA